MSQDPGSGSDETAQPLPQHPLVGRLKPDPAQPAQQFTELAGLPGDSDRAGHQRLYLTARLDYYAEFLVEDIVYSETVPPAQAPLPGLEATRVGIRRDATISYTWVRSPRPVDEFDLDVRLGRARAAGFIDLAGASLLCGSRACVALVGEFDLDVRLGRAGAAGFVDPRGASLACGSRVCGALTDSTCAACGDTCAACHETCFCNAPPHCGGPI